MGGARGWGETHGAPAPRPRFALFSPQKHRRSPLTAASAAAAAHDTAPQGDAGLWDAITSRFENGSFITAVGSNNLHEVHGYNRLASMARGEVLILMQDDDMPPESCAWARHVVQLTRRWPRLGAIGMRNGDMFFPSEALDEVFRPKNLTREEAEGRGKEYPWQHCREGPKQARNLHRDAATGLPFDFVTVVDMAPLARAQTTAGPLFPRSNWPPIACGSCAGPVG